MTDAQKSVMAKCHEMLGEHFESFVIVTADTGTDGNADIRTAHGGGFHAVLGLLTDAQHGYLERDFGDDDDQL